jgi:hypothetical protein
VPPTPAHEALHRIFAEDKTVLPSVMSRVLNIDMPAPADIQELNVDLSEFKPVVERRSDTVARIISGSGNAADDFVLVVESQTEEDDTRNFAWPYYVAYLQAKYKLQVVFVVVTSKPDTARWARGGFRTGLPGLTCQVTTPVVFGPDNVPALTTVAEAARDLHFAVFAALTHSRGPDVRVILEVLAAALETTDKDTASGLSEFAEAGLGATPGFEIWRKLMASGTFTYVSETRAKGRAEGMAAGEAKALLRFLKRRGIVVDDHSRRRIESCTDQETLDTWLDRAVDIQTIDQLFDD